MLSAEEQLHIIASGTAKIVPESALLEKLKRGTPLNIKLGVDPTAARYPSGPCGSAAQAAPVPGPRSRRHAHHRRWHGAYRRSVGP